MAQRDPTRTVANFLADDATWDKRVDFALRNLANGQAEIRSEVLAIKSSVSELPEQIRRVATESRVHYDREIAKLRDRLDEELDSGEEEITGVHDRQALAKNARQWRKQAREEAAQREKWKRRTAAVAPIILGIGAALWELIRAAMH